MALKILLSLVTAYLLGSIPTAYLFGRMLKGIDIREHGSGNVGATNAFRVLGKGAGIAVLLIDIFKGVVATTLIPSLFGWSGTWALILCGIGVISGHNWTCFLRFKGGKGIAATLGVLIGFTVGIPILQPVVLITVGIWIVVFLVKGFVSLASIVAATFLPVSMLIFNAPLLIITIGIIFCIFIVFRHRPNIKRLLEGQESRVNFPYLRK